MSFLLSWLIMAFAVWLTANLLSGFHVKSFGSALFVAAIFGVLNLLLGWLLYGVFAVLSLGIAVLLSFITRWIINAILLKLTDALTDSLKIDSFGWALAGAAMISLISTATEWLLRIVF